MGWLLPKISRRKGEEAEKDLARHQKIMASQQALLEAATATADAAQEVTAKLKSRLADSVAQFESTARILSDALILCDTGDGNIRAFNPAAEQIFGCDAETAMQKSVLEFFEGQFDSVDDLLDKIEKIDGLPPESVRGRHVTGETFWVDINMVRLLRSDRSIVIVLLVRDITAQVEASGLLAEHEHRFRSLFETSFDGVLIVQDMRIVAANDAAKRMFGYEGDSLLTKPLGALVADDDRGYIERHQRERDAGHDAPEQFAISGVHCDGRQLPLRLTTTLITWEGAHACLITAKVEERKARRRNDGADADMIACFTASFTLTFVNDSFARYYGQRRGDLVGRDIRDLMTQSERDTFMLTVNSLSVDAPTRHTQLHVTRNGADCLQDWSDYAVFDTNGRATEYQRVGRDISGLLVRR